MFDGGDGDVGFDAVFFEVFDGALDGEVNAFSGTRGEEDFARDSVDEGGDVVGYLLDYDFVTL